MGQAALGLGEHRLRLDDIPVFLKYVVLDPHDIDNHKARAVRIAVAAVGRHVVALRHNGARFVLGVARQASDKLKEPLSSWRDVGTVLDVVRRSISLCRVEISLIEKHLEALEK